MLNVVCAPILPCRERVVVVRVSPALGGDMMWLRCVGGGSGDGVVVATVLQ
jgi:hypothetical protein